MLLGKTANFLEAYLKGSFLRVVENLTWTFSISGEGICDDWEFLEIASWLVLRDFCSGKTIPDMKLEAGIF